jgi:hypothetical protein
MVIIPWHATVFVEVDAENKKEAEEKALDEAYPSLCHQCSNEIQIDEINDSAEIDISEI